MVTVYIVSPQAIKANPGKICKIDNHKRIDYIVLMDEKLPSGSSGFPNWDNEPSDAAGETVKPAVFSPVDSIADESPATAIPVTTTVSKPQKTSFDDMIEPPAPPPPPALTTPPPPPSEINSLSEQNPPAFESGDSEHPIAVTQVYSSYGLEYLIMLISLGVLAISLGSMLNAVVDLAASKSGSLVSAIFDPYAEAALIVSLPIFAYLFLRLEAREESHPSFLTDSSRRRGIQIILLISFIVFVGELISYIGTLLGSGSDSYGSSADLLYSNPVSSGGSSWWVQLLHAVISLLIAGGVFAYYWYKLHKKTGTNLE